MNMVKYFTTWKKMEECDTDGPVIGIDSNGWVSSIIRVKGVWGAPGWYTHTPGLDPGEDAAGIHFFPILWTWMPVIEDD